MRLTNIAGSDTLRLEGPDGNEQAVAFTGPFRTDHGLAAREVLVAGRGIAPAHEWLVDDLLREGRLELVLPDWRVASAPLSLLVVPDRARLARVRRLVAFLTEAFGTVPGVKR